MLNKPPSPTPAFFRISDRDLTEVELHSVDSINDLHRTHSQQIHKGSRQLHPQGPPTNGNLHVYNAPVICQTGYPRRRRWYKWLCHRCKSTACRYTWGCVVVSLTLMTIFLIFFFLIQQGSALRALSQLVHDRQATPIEISQLIQELQELQRNLTAIKGGRRALLGGPKTGTVSIKSH